MFGGHVPLLDQVAYGDVVRDIVVKGDLAGARRDGEPRAAMGTGLAAGWEGRPQFTRYQAVQCPSDWRCLAQGFPSDPATVTVGV